MIDNLRGRFRDFAPLNVPAESLDSVKREHRFSVGLLAIVPVKEGDPGSTVQTCSGWEPEAGLPMADS